MEEEIFIDKQKLQFQIDYNKACKCCGKYSPFSEIERLFLNAHINDMSLREMSRFLVRDHTTVYRAAKKLGLKSKFDSIDKNQTTSDEELDRYIMQHPEEKAYITARVVKADVRRVKSARERLGL